MSEMSESSGRRVGTREKIQEVALELFAEQGYDKTSLREIAERLNVTKAALYYHFRTKEDIVASLFEDFLARVDDIIKWAGEQEGNHATREGILHRYAEIVGSPEAGRMIEFVQGNQSAVRDLKHSTDLFARFRELSNLLVDPAAPVKAQLKAGMALGVLHIGSFGPINVDATVEQRCAAALEVALELISA